MNKPDFKLENHGSLFLIQPLNAEANAHLVEHVSDEAQWFGNSLAVEPRHVEGLLLGLLNEGYIID